MMAAEGTCAVIVTYQPNVESLLRTVDALATEVEYIVIVDNASSNFGDDGLLPDNPRLRLIRLETNKGIGAAQNRGIAAARRMGCRYVLLLDQDSQPQGGMVRCLLDVSERLSDEGHKVACVGPRVRFPGSADLSTFVTLGWLRRRQGVCRGATSAVECDALISSGSLIPLDIIDKVGPMEEALFIDQVDTEWCLRARAKGYRIFGACGAVLEHRLGESAERFWAGRWRRLPRHKPFRYYYIFRNTITVCRRPYVPARWVLFNFRWLVVLFVVYGLFTRPRMGELGMMFKGIGHGIRGITGKLDHQ